jgi:hypothetical protein
MHHTFPSAWFEPRSDRKLKVQLMQFSQDYSFFFPFRFKHCPQHHILKHNQSTYCFPYVPKAINIAGKILVQVILYALFGGRTIKYASLCQKFISWFSPEFWWCDMNMYLSVCAHTSIQSHLQCFTQAKNRERYLHHIGSFSVILEEFAIDLICEHFLLRFLSSFV